MGRAFNSTEGYFNRLPAAARGVVREAVWNLSLDNTGMFVPFMTDSTEIVFKCVQFGPLSALRISRCRIRPRALPVLSQPSFAILAAVSPAASSHPPSRPLGVIVLRSRRLMPTATP